VHLKYGDLPFVQESEVNSELNNQHGPKWVWYMLRLLSHTDEDAEKALKCEDTQQRLEFLQQSIERTKQVLAAT